MQPRERQDLEGRIHDLSLRGEVGQAVTLALTGYQQEFTRLMESILHDREQARDAVSLLSETLLKELPAFRWESTFRTWACRVARNIGYRLAASPAGRELPVSREALEGQVHRERSRTPPWLQTTVKERVQALRLKLTPHEQAIITLRLERRMSWLGAARELATEEERSNPEALGRKAAVLRQQFQRIKVRLRELAQQEQLISQESSRG
ncbi:sigma-70 family RNA polymerase sigma factor [Corallococcus exiguus]|uniref:RNA polymerase sigma factor n=1 Tax=Corallococcus exiguus TaxID=83462 RepID=UPI001A8F081C|nr:sigma-70 family RNA polymerase sigma factor [Corallococcus exiguus]MBN8468881.1 sigma-70 family RNA polymerase sigma factor [Corallococcus exiguus]